MATYRVDFALSIDVEAENEREAREATEEWLTDSTAEEIVATLIEATMTVERVNPKRTVDDLAARRRAYMDAEIARDYRPGVYNGD